MWLMPCVAISQDSTNTSVFDRFTVDVVAGVTDSSIIHKPGEPSENWSARHTTGKLDIKRVRESGFTAFLSMGLAPKDPKTLEFWIHRNDFFKTFKYFGFSDSNDVFTGYDVTFGRMNVEMTEETSTSVDSLLLVSRSGVADSLGIMDWQLKASKSLGRLTLATIVSLGIQEDGKAKEDSNSHRRTYGVAKYHLPSDIVARASIRIHTIDPWVYAAGISKKGRFAFEVLRFNDIVQKRNITQYYVLYRQPLSRGFEVLGRYENIIGPNKRTIGFGWGYKNHDLDIRVVTSVIDMTDGTRLLNSQFLFHVPFFP